MSGRLWLILGGLVALISAATPPATLAASSGDFTLGPNADSESCRAVARFDVPKGVKASDIYCGAWERPSGRIVIYPTDAAARTALEAICQGVSTPLQSPDFTSLNQVACARKDESGPRRYSLLARHGASVLIGEVYPSDWRPLVTAARVLAGVERPAEGPAKDTGGGETPGLREIQAVYPAGPPGQAAAVNYELLRRRAYEYNLISSFSTAERDFEELERLHQQVAPDDQVGLAEILAEIGLNMSGARRFDEAGDVLDQAEARARAAGDPLLVTKIMNYRALNELNQRHFAAALRLAQQANAARADLVRDGSARNGARITSTDVRKVEGRIVSASHRSLLVSLNEAQPVDKASILNAQADYIAAVAARGIGRTDEAVYLTAAASTLSQVVGAPAALVTEVANERADLLEASGDYAGAAAAAQAGLAMIRIVAPGTRAEAHLWLTLEGAQAGEGQTASALDSGRNALAIYARQTESPGLPPDVAAPHLTLLESEWRRTGDNKLADEYFQTLSLVWDSAAARTSAQLAARLVLGSAGDQARAYQDAERAYRAALARRQALVGDSQATPAQTATADAAIKDASAHFATAESALRDRAPAYLELLDPQAATGDLLAALGNHEAYLRLAVGGKGGFGVLVDKAGAHPFLEPLGESEVQNLVDRLRRSTRIRGQHLPDFNLEASEKLYAALLGPVRDRLADVTDLDVDVSGALASIPFAALVETAPDAATLTRVREDQNYTGVAWLARRVAVANALGPASFIRLRKAPPPPVATLSAAVYGDYVPDPREVAARIAKARDLSDTCRAQIEHDLVAMGPLPETGDDARKVAAKFPGSRLVLGGAFTDADFFTSSQTANADVIMLATHGVLAMSSCFAEPALLTSLGETGDGLIEASALFDRQLKARIVVLSACDTAGGGKLDEARTGLADGGDALSGLARAFIYAGARDVLATQWRVDAAASSAEVGAFFDAASKPGTTLGQALGAAQKTLYDQAETAHPFYWAAFILVGDGGGALASATVAPIKTAAR